MPSTLARRWFAATAAVAAAGLVIQIGVVVTAEHSRWGSLAARVFNVFCYFTILSNLLVAAGCLLLAIRLDRPSTAFRTLRLMGLAGITITGIVYHVAIAHLVEFDGWALAADQITHTVVPVAAVAGWLLYGPRGQTSARVVWLVLAFPVCYLAFSLIRGPIVHWYPYTFLDVVELGYGRVALNCVWLAAIVLAVTAGYHKLDGWLGRVARVPA